MKKRRRAFSALCCALMITVYGFGQESAAPKKETKLLEYDVSLDYLSGLVVPFGRIEIADSGKLKILVLNLLPKVEDYEFALTGIVIPATGKRGLEVKSTEVQLNTGRLLEIMHDPRYQSYQVTVIKKGEKPESRSWFIPVFTHAWTLDFSGAFTFDRLINPLYYLEPGTQAELNQNVPRNGFFVRRNTKGEDAVGLGAAAMVHLYHTKYLHFLKKTFAWAPLSFGLGVGANTETRYYLGSSVRVGDVLFLTAGAVFGKVDRLPANLAEGNFVADADALGTLPRKGEVAFFLGISYAFAGKKAKEQLEQTFSMAYH
jgi:hypothetical protein